MEEMQKNAKAYYRASPDRVKQSANEFFDEMDINKNKRVKREEYLAFMRRPGYAQFNNRNFFSLLDVGQKGYLEFWDVMTLYYIVISGRPFCDGCGIFITGTFFTCLKCFQDSKKSPATSSTFNVCSHCFRNQRYCHSHKQFLDNFLLLELSRVGSNFNEEEIGGRHKVQPRASNPGTSSSRSAQTKPSSSTAIVVAPPRASNRGNSSSQSAGNKRSSSQEIVVAHKPVKPDKVYLLIQLAVLAASQLCTIM